MDKITAYLKANWHTILIGLVMFTVHTLYITHVITAEQHKLILGGLASLGIITMKNSGTTDAVNNTVKMIVIGLMLFAPNFADAQTPANSYTLSSAYQMPGRIRGLNGDTLVNTAVVYDSILLQVPYTSASVVETITKVSGTVSPTLLLQGSVDGIHWSSTGQDTVVLSNATGTVFHTWVLPGLALKSGTTGSTQYGLNPNIIPWLYLRVQATGTGTMSAILKSYIAPR